MTAGGFKRPFSEYIQRLKGYLRYDMPKILYCETKYKAEVGMRDPGVHECVAHCTPVCVCEQIEKVIAEVGRNKIELRFKTTDEIRCVGRDVRMVSVVPTSTGFVCACVQIVRVLPFGGPHPAEGGVVRASGLVVQVPPGNHAAVQSNGHVQGV